MGVRRIRGAVGTRECSAAGGGAEHYPARRAGALHSLPAREQWSDPWPHTLHPTLYTLHHTPYTIHPTVSSSRRACCIERSQPMSTRSQAAQAAHRLKPGCRVDIGRGVAAAHVHLRHHRPGHPIHSVAPPNHKLVGHLVSDWNKDAPSFEAPCSSGQC